jgi:hypothetical protein
MKKIFLILSILISTISLSQVSVVGNITTNGSALYPTHLDSLQRGGFRVVTTIVERNAITDLRRKIGMLVFVNDSNKTYKLTGGITNSDWTLYYDAGSINNKVDTLYRVNDSTVGYTINGRAHTIEILGRLSSGGGGGGSGIISLNTLTPTTQTFAFDQTGTLPGVTSATSVHTFHHPLASGIGVTNGGVSRSDYDRWNLMLPLGDTAAMLANYVTYGRTISTGWGLSGGGDLSINRTHVADSATLSGYYLRRKDSATGINPTGYLTKTSVLNYIPAQFNPIAGANMTLTGTYPNITFTAAGGGGGGVTTIGTLNGGTASVNGGSISGSTLYFQTPDTVLGYPGLMTAQDKRRLYDSVEFLFAAKTNYTALGTTRAPRTIVVKGIQIAINGSPLSPVAEGDSLLKWDITAATTGGGIHAVYNGWGLGKTNDSTLYADSSISGLSSYYVRKKDSSTITNPTGFLTKTSGWNTLGNSGTTAGTNFIGTTDAQALFLKVNNRSAGYISNGYVSDTVLNPAANSGQVSLGQFSQSRYPIKNFGSVFLGYGAGRYDSSATENVFVGLWSGFYTVKGDPTESGHSRNVFIGESTGYRNYSGSWNFYGGAFTGELNATGKYNTGVGASNLRSNRDGVGNTAAGYLGLVYNTTGLNTITLTTKGTGYTTAPTVVISAPTFSSAGAVTRQATATAVLTGDSVTSIIITDPGAGYTATTRDYHANNPSYPYQEALPTITFTGGGGTGATAVATVTSGNNNSSLGTGAGYTNELGQYNTYAGYSAISGKYDDYGTLLGANTGKLSSLPTTVAGKLTNYTAIGARALVGCSNCLILGDTALGTKTGIGTTQPDSLLTVQLGIWGKRGVRFSGLSASANATDSMMVVNASNGNVGYRAIPSAGASGLTVGTTTITSGTSGAIPYNNGGIYSEDATQLFWNTTDNRLGIGTNSPSERLHIVGRLRQDTAAGVTGVDHFLQTNGRNLLSTANVNPGIDVFHDANNMFGFNLGYTTGTGRYSLQNFFSDIGDYVIASHANGSLPTGVGSFTPLVTVRGDNGRLGIGVSAPSEKLEVSGNVRFSGALMPNNTAGTSGYLLTSAGAGSPPTWTNPSSLGLTVGTTTIASGTTTRILYDNAGVLGEYTLTGTGTVVAMQTSPTFVTPLLGTPTSGVLTNTTGYLLNNVAAMTGSSTINNGANALELQWNSLSTGNGLKLSSTSTGAASSTQTLLNLALSGINANSSEVSYALRIDNSHAGTSPTNYGVYSTISNGGTAVYGAGNDGTLAIGGDFYADYGTTGIAGRFTVGTNGSITNRYAIIVPSAGGSVGIGTSSPTSLLHVVTVPTTGIGASFSSATTTSGTILNIAGTSTVLAANNEMLNISSSGANGTSAITATGARISVTNTNATSGTNVGLDLTASGAITANNALNISAGAIALNGSAGTSGQYLTSAGAGTVPTWTTPPTIAYGNYTPSTTLTTNLAAATAYVTNYYRVGDMVTVFGKMSVDPTSVGACVLTIDVPVSSGMTGTGIDAGGTAASPTITAEAISISSGGSDQILFKWVATDISNHDLFFTFSYKITPP